MLATGCRLIDLPAIPDARGSLTFVESPRHLPFSFKRAFCMYDIPAGAARGGHALKQCQQFIMALSGAMDVVLDDGRGLRERVRLDRPSQGLLVPPLVWRELDRFADQTVCLVLASHEYSEADYYRDYDQFKTAVNP
jgi:hypothetical protein